MHHFMPTAIETSGVFDNEAKKFKHKVIHRGDWWNETSYPFQQIWVAIHGGNAISYHGTFAKEFKTKKVVSSINTIFSVQLRGGGHKKNLSDQTLLCNVCNILEYVAALYKLDNTN